MSKVIEFASDTFALPLFLLLYGTSNMLSPISYVIYVVFFMLFTEFIVKGIFQRHRPAWTRQMGFAFPSSHSLVATICFVTALLMPIPFPYKGIALAVSGFVPLNRIMLGHHYIADVTIGVIGGVVVGLLWVFYGAGLGLP